MENKLQIKQRTTIATNLAKNVVLARNVRNLTQTEIGKKANISRATIAQIESGEGDPRLSTITDIATSLDISPVLLLMGKDEINALVDLLKNYEEDSVSEDKIQQMQQFLSSGILKLTIKAATLGASAYVSKSGPDKKSDSGAETGAAIGSALLPGLGTAIGASMGAFFSSKYNSKDKNKE